MKTIGLWVLAMMLVPMVSAIGVSPPKIILNDLLKDSYTEPSVFLQGIEPGSEVTVRLSGDSDWVEVPIGSSFTFPDTSQMELPFIISVPSDAPNGEYKAVAEIIASSPRVAQSNAATVLAGVTVELEFSVSGQEVRQYRIMSTEIPETEIGSPLLVVMKIDNEGNVLAGPSEVELIIKDKTREELLFSEKSSDIKGVEPRTTGESVVTFENTLEPGFYFATILIYEGELKENISDIPIDILQRGLLEASGEFISLRTQDTIETLAQITGEFMNTGNVDLYVKLVGEVFRDGVIIDHFETESEYVDVGITKEFVYYYDVPGHGEYVVKAHAEFFEVETDTREVSFSVIKSKSYDLYILGAVILVILLVIFIFMGRKK